MNTSYETTLVSIFCRRVAEHGDRPALWIRRDGDFHPHSWNEVARHVRQTAAALVRLGVEPEDRVIQVSENRLEWIIADLAIQMARAVHVPVHAPLTGEQIAPQILDCGARLVLLSGPEQAGKLAAVGDRLPGGLQYLAYDPCEVTIRGQPIRRLDDVTTESDEQAAATVQEAALGGLTPDSLATILYTSGTTGEPKGVMLSQRNLVSNTLATMAGIGQHDGDLRLCFLPLSHVFARTCDLYTWLANGTELALAASRESVMADCAALRPSLLNGVPYFLEKVYRGLCEHGLENKPGVLKDVLGGNLRLCCSGGAALPDHVFDFYQQQGVHLLQGYGLTESSPVITTSTPSAVKRGAVGRPIADVQVQIAADGEILTRGPHVMIGYWNNQQATDEVIRDGWLHTGDIGELDEEGYLRITGRKKELIVTAGGKNIATVYLEALLTEDPLISQALVIGDGRKFLSVLIVPDGEQLKAALNERSIPSTNMGEILQQADVRALYQNRIKQRLAGVSHYEQVGAFTLLEHEFTVEEGEMTPKLSLRRKVIEAHFAGQIEAMYRGG